MPGMGQPRTQSVACLSKWRVPPFNGQVLPIVECTDRRAWMHSRSYSSTNRLPYFFDPRPVLTLGSLARTTVALWEFRQIGFFRLSRRRTSKSRLRDWASITCAVRRDPRDGPRRSDRPNLCDSGMRAGGWTPTPAVRAVPQMIPARSQHSGQTRRGGEKGTRPEVGRHAAIVCCLSRTRLVPLSSGNSWNNSAPDHYAADVTSPAVAAGPAVL